MFSIHLLSLVGANRPVSNCVPGGTGRKAWHQGRFPIVRSFHDRYNRKMSNVTHLLDAAAAGDRRAAADLLPLVYDELRKLAAARMAAESPGQTLQPTALVHEAYLRLAGDQRFDGRGHFFAAAAEAMRRILVNHARDRKRRKRGDGRVRLDLLDQADSLAEDPDLILKIAIPPEPTNKHLSTSAEQTERRDHDPAGSPPVARPLLPAGEGGRGLLIAGQGVPSRASLRGDGVEHLVDPLNQWVPVDVEPNEVGGQHREEQHADQPIAWGESGAPK